MPRNFHKVFIKLLTNQGFATNNSGKLRFSWLLFKDNWFDAFSSSIKMKAHLFGTLSSICSANSLPLSLPRGWNSLLLGYYLVRVTIKQTSALLMFTLTANWLDIYFCIYFLLWCIANCSQDKQHLPKTLQSKIHRSIRSAKIRTRDLCDLLVLSPKNRFCSHRKSQKSKQCQTSSCRRST